MINSKRFSNFIFRWSMKPYAVCKWCFLPAWFLAGRCCMIFPPTFLTRDPRTNSASFWITWSLSLQFKLSGKEINLVDPLLFSSVPLLYRSLTCMDYHCLCLSLLGHDEHINVPQSGTATSGITTTISPWWSTCFFKSKRSKSWLTFINLFIFSMLYSNQQIKSNEDSKDC